MSGYIWVLICGCILGSAPISEVVAQIASGGLRSLRRPLPELPIGAGVTRLAVECGLSLVMYVLVQAMGGGRFGLVCAGVGLVAGNVWSWPLSGRQLSGSKYSRGSVAAATMLLFMSPRIVLVACIVWGLVYTLYRTTRGTTLIVAFTLPVAVMMLGMPDIVFVYTTISAGLIGSPHLLRAGLLGVKLARPVRVLAYVALVMSLLLVAYANRYVYRGVGPPKDILRQGPSNLPVVALTFDDGPDKIYTPLILDILAERDVRATFYVVGRQVEKYPDVARRIVADGHEIGNHSYSHRNMWRMPEHAAYDEIVRAEQVIYQVTGRRPFTFRPPRGLYNEATLKHLAELNQPMVLWSLSSQDWAEVPARTIEQRVLNMVSRGDIILFHDGGDIFADAGGDRMNTVLALPRIIDELKERGFYFVTITEMMILSGLMDEDQGSE